MPYTKKYYYLKLKEDFFDHKEIKYIEKQDKSRAACMLYLHMLTKADYFKHGYRYIRNSLNISNDEYLAIVFNFEQSKIKYLTNILFMASVLRIKNDLFILRDINIDIDKSRSCSEYSEWRYSVFIRDNWTCKNCGQRGGKLNAHHIKKWSEYPSLRFELDNGITLCKECHKVEHKKRNNE
jgi:hypothetical protein